MHAVCTYTIFGIRALKGYYIVARGITNIHAVIGSYHYHEIVG